MCATNVTKRNLDLYSANNQTWRASKKLKRKLTPCGKNENASIVRAMGLPNATLGLEKGPSAHRAKSAHILVACDWDIRISFGKSLRL
jgi:hypothetical protein